MDRYSTPADAFTTPVMCEQRGWLVSDITCSGLLTVAARKLHAGKGYADAFVTFRPRLGELKGGPAKRLVKKTLLQPTPTSLVLYKIIYNLYRNTRLLS